MLMQGKKGRGERNGINGTAVQEALTDTEAQQEARTESQRAEEAGYGTVRG